MPVLSVSILWRGINAYWAKYKTDAWLKTRHHIVYHIVGWQWCFIYTSKRDNSRIWTAYLMLSKCDGLDGRWKDESVGKWWRVEVLGCRWLNVEVVLPMSVLWPNVQSKSCCVDDCSGADECGGIPRTVRECVSNWEDWFCWFLTDKLDSLKSCLLVDAVPDNVLRLVACVLYSCEFWSLGDVYEDSICGVVDNFDTGGWK